MSAEGVLGRGLVDRRVMDEVDIIGAVAADVAGAVLDEGAGRLTAGVLMAAIGP